MNHQFINEHKNVIPDSVPGSPFWTFALLKSQPCGSAMPNFVSHVARLKWLSSLVFILVLTACSDFIHPVKSTPEPTEYSFNYWLLQRQYLYEDELANLEEEGDSVQTLYKTLKDPYTNYTPPAKSEVVGQQIRTSIVIGGDIGLRYYNLTDQKHPVYIYRVYPKGPAGRANVPKYGNIISVNDVELTGEKAKATYDSILSVNKNVDLLIAYKGDTTLYKLEKETIYAPTVFLDTLFEDSAKGYPGIIFVDIEIFKDTTEDRKNGSYGELKAYLDSTASDNHVRVLDLRGNPGGSVKQCIKMADLFVKEGTLSTNNWRSLDGNGNSRKSTTTFNATAGDPGEQGKFIILANGGSASCAEIFIAAVTETTDIPLVGSKTYGKGIGQTNFKTYANGLATINHADTCGQRAQLVHTRVFVVGVGVSRVPEGVPLDARGLDVPDVADLRRPALVRNGGVRAGVDSYGGGVPHVPARHTARHSAAVHEVGG